MKNNKIGKNSCIHLFYLHSYEPGIPITLFIEFSFSKSQNQIELIFFLRINA